MTQKLLAFLTLLRRRHLARQACNFYLISQTMVMMLLKTVDTSEFYFDKFISIKVTLELQSKQQSIANKLVNIDICCKYFRKEVIH